MTLTTITSHILVLTVQYHSAPNNLLETHNTAIQFNCTICNIAFQSKSIFNRHSKQHYIDHVSLVRQIVVNVVDSVVPVKCKDDCPHCILLRNTEFMIEILLKERDELLKHVQN